MSAAHKAADLARFFAGRLRYAAREWLAAALDLLYPPACPCCRSGMPKAGLLCESCLARCVPVRRPFCERCSLPFEGLIPRPFRCPNCAGRELAFRSAVAVWRASGPVRELIHGFKYDGRMALAEVFLPWLREALLDPRIAEIERPLLVPVPLHPARCRERGYNQAALLAERLARAEGWECAAALRRIRYTTTQTALDRKQRARNLAGAFDLRPGVSVRGREVILVDDVLTTCATVSECASVLLRAGAAGVNAVAVARA